VGRQLQKSSPAAPAAVSEPAPQAAEAQAAGPAHIEEIVGPGGTVRYVSR
jgi:hypothetical protein